MKLPIITDYVGLQDAALEERRRQKLDAISKQYPNKRIIVTKDLKVFVQK